MNWDSRIEVTMEINLVRCGAHRAASVVAVCLALLFVPALNVTFAGNESGKNKLVARAAFLDFLNGRDFKQFEAAHMAGFVKHYNNSPAENLAEEMEDARGQFVSSSDLKFSINWMIAEADKVAVCFTARGTHDGAFHDIQPTGKKFEIVGMTVWRFENGKIAEEWVFSNDLDLYRQLGLFTDTKPAKP